MKEILRAEQFKLSIGKESIWVYPTTILYIRLFRIIFYLYYLLLFPIIFGVQIRNKVITISVYALYFVLTIGTISCCKHSFLNLIFTIVSLFLSHYAIIPLFPKRASLHIWIYYFSICSGIDCICSNKNAYIEPPPKIYEYENEIGIFFLSRMVIFWVVLLLGYFSHHRNEQKILLIWTMCLFLRAYQSWQLASNCCFQLFWVTAHHHSLRFSYLSSIL